MVFSGLLLLLILLMTACQTAPALSKSAPYMDYGFEHRSRPDCPVLHLTADTIKYVKNTIIFEGKPELKRDPAVKFLADHISIEYIDENRRNYVVEMKGNVSMMTSAALIIKSEGATSLDFINHIDFAGNVSISNKGRNYNTEWVRYFFAKGELEFRRGDFPIRADIVR